MIEGLNRKQTNEVLKGAGIQPAFWGDQYSLEWYLDKSNPALFAKIEEFIESILDPRRAAIGYLKLDGAAATVVPQLLTKELVYSGTHAARYEASEFNRDSLWDDDRPMLAEVGPLAFLAVEGLRPQWQPGHIPCRQDELHIVRDFFKRQTFENRALLYVGELNLEEPSWWGPSFDKHLKNCLTFTA